MKSDPHRQIPPPGKARKIKIVRGACAWAPRNPDAAIIWLPQHGDVGNIDPCHRICMELISLILCRKSLDRFLKTDASCVCIGLGGWFFYGEKYHQRRFFPKRTGKIRMVFHSGTQALRHSGTQALRHSAGEIFSPTVWSLVKSALLAFALAGIATLQAAPPRGVFNPRKSVRPSPQTDSIPQIK